MLRQAREIALEHDLEALGSIYFNLSDAEFFRDQYEEALDYLEQGLALSRRRGNRLGEWATLAETTFPLLMLGRWDEALERAGEIPEDRLQETTTLSLLESSVQIRIARGDVAEARRVLGLYPETSADVQERAIRPRCARRGAARGGPARGRRRPRRSPASRAWPGTTPAAVFSPQQGKQAFPLAVETLVALGRRGEAADWMARYDAAPPRPPAAVRPGAGAPAAGDPRRRPGRVRSCSRSVRRAADPVLGGGRAARAGGARRIRGRAGAAACVGSRGVRAARRPAVAGPRRCCARGRLRPGLANPAPRAENRAVRHELPSGSVTFLFTDIEGSTRLLHEIGDAYVDVLAEHRRVLRQAFQAHGGVEVDTQGDAFFVAFAEAGAAVAAAVAGQDALAAGPVRVRMGVHTGAPAVTDEGYVGHDVHLGARIAAAAHGGQILLSHATRRLVDADVVDLGEHRLKDFDQPVWLFQAGSRQFPPLRTIANTNLPRPASNLVGRGRELDELTALLGDARFVTVAGAGGAGKTRLAVEAAARVVTDFANGVYWIPLASVRDPSLVLPQVAQTIGIDAERLAPELRSRRLLLLLDNFEHVIEAAPRVASLVEDCPGVTVLVTSREPLRVRGEHHYALEALADQEAVELFCQRAHTTATAAVASLCRGLDNLPLAVELAAARATLLSPEEILERIAERLDLLRGGRDADDRQRTLRATIDWSVQLLEPAELHLFTALGAFVGGCTVAAAEAVGEAGIDELQSLVDKSLLRRADGRLIMLETVREYARERLAADDAHDEIEQRHARYYLELAQAAGGPFPTVTSAEVVGERPNIRAAVAFAARRGDVALEFALLGQTTDLMTDSLPRYRSRLEELLAADPAVEPATLARCLGNLSFATYLAGDLERAKQLAQLEYDVGAPVSEWAESAALNSLAGVYLAEGDAAAARAALERAAELQEGIGAWRAAAITKVNLADTIVVEGEYAAAARPVRRRVRRVRGAGRSGLGDGRAGERRHRGPARRALRRRRRWSPAPCRRPQPFETDTAPRSRSSSWLRLLRRRATRRRPCFSRRRTSCGRARGTGSSRPRRAFATPSWQAGLSLPMRLTRTQRWLRRRPTLEPLCRTV